VVITKQVQYQDKANVFGCFVNHW